MAAPRRTVLSLLAAVSWTGLSLLACSTRVSLGEAGEGAAGFGPSSGVGMPPSFGGPDNTEADGGPDAAPYHYAGQPCLECHSTTFDGGATPFLLAGTLFDTVNGGIGVSGGNLIFTDSTDAGFSTTTNCVGNFYVLPSQFPAVFPLHVTVGGGAGEMASMQSPISLAATNCATCHTYPPAADAGGPLFVGSTPLQPDTNCPFDASVMFSP